MNLVILIIYTFFVTYSSLSQASYITTPDIEHVDKVYHFILYGIFTLLAFRISKTKIIFYIICIGIVTYSGLMEIGQSLVPNRSMSLYDLIANSIGVILACIIATKYLNFNEEKKNNN
ncbi:MAG: VanZ family protein [Planctomycetota bacterium]|jgi:VanZ family protein